LSLVIMMALKFIPQFKKQIKNVHETQKTLGLYSDNRMKSRLMNGIKTFYSMISWSLETAVEQGDAMKAKGYGLKGRTRSEEHTSELQSRFDLVCRLLLEKKKKQE